MLIIESDDVLRRTTTRQFQALKWNVISAHDLKSGLELAIRYQPSVIISDLALPDAAGYGFARTLRTLIDHDIRVVGMTTDPENLCAEVRAAGFDLVFAKPLDVAQTHEQLGRKAK